MVYILVFNKRFIECCISLFLENRVDERIYETILMPISGLKKADTVVQSNILSSFYNIISKDKESIEYCYYFNKFNRENMQ